MRFYSCWKCWDGCNIVIILLYADVRNIQCVWHMYMSLYANPLQVVCWHIVITCTFIFIIGFPYMLIDEATVWHKYAEGQIALCTASNGVVCAIHSFHFILNKTGVHIILFILLDVLIACYAILLDCDTHSNGTFTKCSWFFSKCGSFLWISLQKYSYWSYDTMSRDGARLGKLVFQCISFLAKF